MNKMELLIENGVDVEKGIELLGDVDTYNEMLDDFLLESDEKLVQINHFQQQRDMINYAILAHSLKSDAKYFGFTNLADIAYQHELESKSGNIEFINQKISDLNIEAKKIIDLIKKYRG